MNDIGAPGAFRSTRKPLTAWLQGRRAAAMVTDFLRDETAATVVEYGLIAGVLSLAGLAGIPTVGSKLLDLYGRVVSSFP